MKFIKIPISYNDDSLIQSRIGVRSNGVEEDEEYKKAVLDNLVELIVFTPRGSCAADPDFGFEYWNYEYTNINLTDFNNGINISNQESAQSACQESIKQSLENYQSYLRQINVSVELDTIDAMVLSSHKLKSKYKVNVRVNGFIGVGLSTQSQYMKQVSFLIEPTVKKT